MRRRLPAACWLAVALSAAGADWPQLFRDNARNAVSPETNLPAFFLPGTTHLHDTNSPPPERSNLKWRLRLGNHAYAGPVIAKGRIYVGTTNKEKGGLLLVLDEATGEPLWRLSVPVFATEVYEYNFDDMDLGLCSTPTVVEDRLYLVSNRDELLCVNLWGRNVAAHDRWAREVWAVEGSRQAPLAFGGQDEGIEWICRMLTEPRVEAWVQDAASCSPLVDGNLVYVCPGNGVDRGHKKAPHPDAPSLIAVDRATGRVVARDFEGVGARLFHGEWSSPALGGVNGRKLVFFGAGDGVCYAFDAAPAPPAAGAAIGRLNLVWKFDLNAAAGRRGAYRTPAGPSEVIATPVFRSNRVYLAVGQDPRHREGRGGLACIDATKTGDITTTGALWVNKDIDRSLTTVALAEGLLFTADFSGRIFCLDQVTGAECWRYESGRPIWSSPLVADGKVYLGTDTGDLLCFAAARDRRLLGRTKLDSAISASPAAANGVLYVMSQRWLYAVATGADRRE